MADSVEVDWDEAKKEGEFMTQAEADKASEVEARRIFEQEKAAKERGEKLPSDPLLDNVKPPEPQAPVAPGSHPLDDSDQARDVQEQQSEVASSEPQKVEEEDDPIEIIQPKAEPKTWTFKDQSGGTASYVQTGLSYFGKMQWFSLVGEVVDKALSGDDKVEISSLFDGGLSGVSDLRELDTFLQAASKLLVYAPDFLVKSYCIWLNIPDHERPWARIAMSQNPAEGGLTDDQGIEIIEIFIDQNWEAIDTFFRDKLPLVLDRARSRRLETEESRRSKP